MVAAATNFVICRAAQAWRVRSTNAARTRRMLRLLSAHAAPAHSKGESAADGAAAQRRGVRRCEKTGYGEGE